MKGMWSRALAVSLLTAGAVGGVSGAAWATPITIVNPSFEVDTTPNGSNGTQNYWYAGSFTGWTLHGPAGGWFHPSAASYPGGGSVNSPASGIPQGTQVAWIQSGSSLTQALSAVYKPFTEYSLTFSVGRRADLAVFPNYSIELTAGGHVVATITSPVLPTAGSFSSFGWTVITGTSPYSGQTLGITLLASYNTSAQVNFDNFALTEVTGVPEPGTLSLLGVGICGLFAVGGGGTFWRRRDNAA